MTSVDRNKILEHTEIQAKVERIAHEIHENYFQEKKIILVGILGRGYEFATRLHKILKEIADFDIELLEIILNKDEPLSNDITIDKNTTFKNKSVLLVDDVLNSGKTLAYAASYLLNQAPKSLKTVILVNRKHIRYPVTADFVGLSLATTMNEHIAVEFGKKDAVFLD
ncbi:MAG: phosphoribosyltransferase [Crocinitomicaceae bacterium]|nr:phosphoribosyltransferase [Crocinitomicaceae bacterium]|tara:strand:- start:868 stop:1371 length:504 start_codon:yes stop_codon:yes gene_type:complete